MSAQAALAIVQFRKVLSDLKVEKPLLTTEKRGDVNEIGCQFLAIGMPWTASNY